MANLIQFARIATLAFLLGISLHAYSESPDLQVVSFIGRIVSIVELPDPCATDSEQSDESADSDSICVSMNVYFEATYDIVDVISGEIGATPITFNIADHYGFPGFAEYQHALLFVHVSPEGNWLEKYQGFPVHRTLDGSWASCGNPYDDRFYEGTPRHLQRISFMRSLGTVGDYSKYGVEKRFGCRFGDDSYLTISEGQVWCQTGIYFFDLYELIRSGVMSARGIQLPALGTPENDL